MQLFSHTENTYKRSPRVSPPKPKVNHKSPTHKIHIRIRRLLCTRLVSRMKLFGGSFARARAGARTHPHFSQNLNVRAPERYRLVILSAVCYLLVYYSIASTLCSSSTTTLALMLLLVWLLAVGSCWHKNYLPFCVFFFLWFIYIITLCVTIIPNAVYLLNLLIVRAHSHMWHRISHRFSFIWPTHTPRSPSSRATPIYESFERRGLSIFSPLFSLSLSRIGGAYSSSSTILRFRARLNRFRLHWHESTACVCHYILCWKHYTIHIWWCSKRYTCSVGPTTCIRSAVWAIPTIQNH